MPPSTSLTTAPTCVDEVDVEVLVPGSGNWVLGADDDDDDMIEGTERGSGVEGTSVTTGTVVCAGKDVDVLLAADVVGGV